MALLLSSCDGGSVGGSLLSLVEWDSEYTDQWSLPLGSHGATIDAKDPDGKLKNFTDLTGENGLLIFFVRSSDW